MLARREIYAGQSASASANAAWYAFGVSRETPQQQEEEECE